MPLPTIPSGNVNSGLATGYDVANSCRFDRGSSASMHITFSGAGDRQKFTFSFWVKRNKLGTQEVIFDTNFGGGANEHRILFDSSDRLEYYDYSSSTNNLKYVTNRLFRDTAAWYSIIIAVDTTQGTAGNRVKIYINGTQETSFGTETQPSENLTTQLNTAVKHQIGVKNVSSNYLDAYLAEFVFISGTQYAASDFGEFDSDSPRIWKPKDVSGLTFGTNGFYLDFEDSSNLGNDANGGTDLTEANIAATDQSTDTCTNNFATLNPLIAQGGSAPTMTEGNLKITVAGAFTQRPSTMVVNKGKWYAEVFMHTLSSSGQYATFGITGVDDLNLNHRGFAGSAAQGMIIALDNRTDQTLIQGNDSTVLDPNIDPDDDDIVGMALDLDNGKIYFHLNGTYVNSGDPTSGATGTGAVDVPTADIDYFITYGVDDSVISANFGGCQAFTISSANADGNGYGNFEFAVPANYYSLCTKNLAEYG
ncbi:spry domain protein [uncultured Mediterranean phage uvDeep-CGR2-AD8-C175]|nr:spry domain protein [uncultured Mediterranean phage uvDeep-CGR2-AD8-C175]